MNKTGTYIWEGRTWVKVTDDPPSVTHRDAWMPKGDRGYYDKSAQTYFESRSEKRRWLLKNKMREGGIITNPDKRLEGSWRNAGKPTLAQRSRRERSQAWLRAQGGTEGLLQRRAGG